MTDKINKIDKMEVLKTEVKKLASPVERRRKKGVEMFMQGYVAAMDKTGIHFKVRSQSAADGVGWYIVVLDPETKIGHCTCCDFVYNNTQCKHIIASKFMRHELGYAI
jgi:hypothetical protein